MTQHSHLIGIYTKELKSESRGDINVFLVLTPSAVSFPTVKLCISEGFLSRNTIWCVKETYTWV